MLAELAEAVRTGRVSPVELVTEALRRIEATNGDVNAVVALRVEEALAEAEAHDRTGALAGIPLLVKDLEDVTGMRTTFGSLLHADDPEATDDGTVVRALRDAGAIVIGKTNTPEYAWTGYTTNRVFGPTRNPWNLEASPGGSSGGSSAALTAGYAPLATTSDGGGSVRGPAAECGLVGWKSTFGVVGRGRVPVWPTFSANGATGATVADVILEASVISGPQPGDVFALPEGAVSLTPQPPARIVAIANFKKAVDPAVRDAFEQTVAVLQDDLSFPVTDVSSVFSTDPAPEMAWLFIAAAEMHAALGSNLTERADDLDVGMKLMASVGDYIDTGQYIAAQKVRFEASRQLDELLGDDGVLVLPTANARMWPAEGPFPTSIDGVDVAPTDSLNTMEFNLTGHPAVTVPMGVGPEGVPMGFQIVAPRFRDDLALGVAAALEEARPWPATAPGYDPFPLP